MRALESPKARAPSAPPSLPSLWISKSLLGCSIWSLSGEVYQFLYRSRDYQTQRKAGRGTVHITDHTTKTKTLYKKCEALFGIVSLTGMKWAGCLDAPAKKGALKVGS